MELLSRDKIQELAHRLALNPEDEKAASEMLTILSRTRLIPGNETLQRFIQALDLGKEQLVDAYFRHVINGDLPFWTFLKVFDMVTRHTMFYLFIEDIEKNRPEIKRLILDHFKESLNHIDMQKVLDKEVLARIPEIIFE